MIRCDYCGMYYDYAVCPYDGSVLSSQYAERCSGPVQHDLKVIPLKYRKYSHYIGYSPFQSIAACPNCRTPYFYNNLSPEEKAEFNRLRNAASCFIATAALGSHLHPSVQSLREFRDNILLKSRHRETFEGLLNVYYKFSPPIARTMGENNILRITLRYCLVYPVVFGIKALLPIFNCILGIEKDAKSRQ